MAQKSTVQRSVLYIDKVCEIHRALRNQETSQMLWLCFPASANYSVHSPSSSSGVSLGKSSSDTFKPAETERVKLITLSREYICLHNYFRKTFERFCAVFNFLLKKKKKRKRALQRSFLNDTCHNCRRKENIFLLSVRASK